MATFENVRTNQLSAGGTAWFQEVLRVIETMDADAYGLVDTEGTRAAGSVGTPVEAEVVKMTPLGRIGVPDDIGPVAAFLASEDARWISGDVLFATGGLA